MTRLQRWLVTFAIAGSLTLLLGAQVKIIPAGSGSGGGGGVGGTCGDGTYVVSIAADTGVPTCSAIPPTTTTQSTSRATTLVTGGQVAWSSGLVFRVSAATYFIEGVQYTSVEQTVTLSTADATNPRFDVIVLDDVGVASSITGTPGATPAEPGIDAGSQLRLSLVSVPANASVIAVTSTILYAENAGSGSSEWDWTTSGSGFNANSSTNPHAGSKDIEGTTVAANAYAQGQIGSGSIQPASVERLVFFIRSKASWANKRVLKVQFQSSGAIVGNVITISTGAYGFDSSVTASYQQIVIPFVHFAVPTTSTFNQIRITDSGGSIGFYLDDVSLQGGTAQTQAVSGLTQDQADARYVKLSTFEIVRDYPAWTPTGDDDEFDNGSFTGWTAVNSGSHNPTITETNGVASFLLPGGDAASEQHAYVKPRTIVANDWIEVAFKHSGPTQSYNIFGAVFADGATYNAGTQVTFAVSPNLTQLPYYSYTGYNSASVLSAPGSDSGFPQGLCFLRFKYRGSNSWQGYLSTDGISWAAVDVPQTRTLTPTHVGFWMTTWGGNGQHVWTVLYARFGNG